MLGKHTLGELNSGLAVHTAACRLQLQLACFVCRAATCANLVMYIKQLHVQSLAAALFAAYLMVCLSCTSVFVFLQWTCLMSVTSLVRTFPTPTF